MEAMEARIAQVKAYLTLMAFFLGVAASRSGAEAIGAASSFLRSLLTLTVFRNVLLIYAICTEDIL
jgi:hypothetical protein